jgi:FAD/FMN-containing dehydrogenase
MDVVVQPSVPWMSLNDQLKHSGLFFPVDPGPSVRVDYTVYDCDKWLIAIITGSNWGNGWHKLQV